MFRYEIHGVTLASYRPLPLPEAHQSREAAIELRLGADTPRPEGWSIEKQGPGDQAPWFRVAQLGDGYALSCAGRVDYVSRSAGRVLLELPASGIDSHLVDHFLIDHVIPHVLQLLGCVCLHASAVLGDDGVSVFVGESGVGKSTLAASIRERAISDDCVALTVEDGVVVAARGPSRARLRPASAEFLGAVGPHSAGRTLVALGNTVTTTAPVSSVDSLHRIDSGELRAHRLSLADAVAELLPHVIRLDPFRADLLAREFDVLVSLCARAVVTRVDYPHRRDALQTVIEGAWRIKQSS